MIERSKHIVCLILLLVVASCVDEINIPEETSDAFEPVLVVEATLTNELKNHQVILSLTNPLSNSGLPPTYETNAQVTIEQNGVAIAFEEIENGIYQSVQAFQAASEVDYQLKIIRSNGKVYQSDVRQLTTATVMDDLYVERGFNENDEEGVSVLIDAFDPSNTSKYYRFEYLEAYRIEAPLWTPEDLIFDTEAEGGPCVPESYITIERSTDEQVCFNEKRSDQIIVTNTIDLSEDRLDQYRVRFLSRNNYIITHRYTILVRQYVLSQDAYFYYEAIANFSDNEDILSESQPGFVQGNIRYEENEDEQVVGFFDVSFVDEKRVYFNYEDLFPGEDLPPYVNDCTFFVAPLLCVPDQMGCRAVPLICLLEDLDLEGNPVWKYYSENETPSSLVDEGPYNLVPRACGDCTALGNTNPPDYWED